jgi:DNA-binding transcriptional MerR regulator
VDSRGVFTGFVGGAKPIGILSPLVSDVVIPNRPVFRAQEVCEIAGVQAYVLRSWEAEFPDLGFAKTPSSPRVYRRGDLERVLRLKHLLFVDGLTLAGARKRLLQEGAVAEPNGVSDGDLAAMVDEQTRQSLRELRGGLQWILNVLSGQGAAAEPFALRPQPARAPVTTRKSRPPARTKAAKKPAKTAKRKR